MHGTRTLSDYNYNSKQNLHYPLSNGREVFSLWISRHQLHVKYTNNPLSTYCCPNAYVLYRVSMLCYITKNNRIWYSGGHQIFILGGHLYAVNYSLEVPQIDLLTLARHVVKQIKITER